MPIGFIHKISYIVCVIDPIRVEKLEITKIYGSHEIKTMSIIRQLKFNLDI